MAPANSIPRQKGPPDEYSFDSLRRAGVEWIQEVSHNSWTDYNEHDPGVTILEQVCYALTDLIYRAQFDIPDLLVDPEGSIDWERQSLLPAEMALPSRATSKLDYRSIILDQVKAVESVSLEVVTDSDQRPTGLYNIRLRLRADTAGLGMEGPVREGAGTGDSRDADKITQAVRKVFAANRNLCEDLQSISLRETADYILMADVEIADDADAAEILARIYHECSLFLASGIEFTPYGRAMAYGDSPEEFFRGPFVRSGKIVRDVGDTRSDFAASEVYSCIKPIKGVLSVKALPGEIHPAPDPKTPDDQKPVLRLHWPSKQEEVRVRIFRNRRQLKVSLHELNMRFEELSFANRGMRPDSGESIVPLPSGTARDLGSYSSVQYDLPPVYGMGRRGVSASASNRDQARARQLRAYLLLFDQQIANSLATLAHLRDLYSTELKQYETYFYQPLNEESFPYITQTYGADTLAHLDEVYRKYRHTQRAKRLLDYLLALYGESFRDDPLVSHVNGDTREQEAVVAARIRYLKDVAYITRDRFAATDYTEPYEKGHSFRTAGRFEQRCHGDQDNLPGECFNRSGLEAKLSHLLGYEAHYRKTGHGVRVIEHILLRPRDWPEKHTEHWLPFRVTVLLPAWIHPGDKQNFEEFQKFAVDTIDTCCPAHIYADVHWVTSDEAKEFDNLHRQWWEHPGASHGEELLNLLVELGKKGANG